MQTQYDILKSSVPSFGSMIFRVAEDEVNQYVLDSNNEGLQVIMRAAQVRFILDVQGKDLADESGAKIAALKLMVNRVKDLSKRIVVGVIKDTGMIEYAKTVKNGYELKGHKIQSDGSVLDEVTMNGKTIHEYAVRQAKNTSDFAITLDPDEAAKINFGALLAPKTAEVFGDAAIRIATSGRIKFLNDLNAIPKNHFIAGYKASGTPDNPSTANGVATAYNPDDLTNVALREAKADNFIKTFVIRVGYDAQGHPIDQGVYELDLAEVNKLKTPVRVTGIVGHDESIIHGFQMLTANSGKLPDMSNDIGAFLQACDINATLKVPAATTGVFGFAKGLFTYEEATHKATVKDPIV